jgi:hypothetical protein
MNRALAGALALAAIASCGGGSTGDQATKFTGPWTFTSGELTPVCIGGIAVSPFSLAGLGVVFEKVDDSTIKLTAGTSGCEVKFKVSGNTATAEKGSTCALDLGPPLGPQTIMIAKWTLKLSGERIDNDISGAVSLCMASGTGVMMKGAPDGGAPRPDGGHEAGATEAGGDVATDTATEAATEAGGDTATEAAIEAGGDTAAEASTEAGGDTAAEAGGGSDGGADGGTDGGDAATDASAAEAG